MVDETMQETEREVLRNLIAEDFATRLRGRLDQDKIDAATHAVRTTTQRYPGSLSLASLMFYLKLTIDMEDGEQFNGDCGGVGTPGGNWATGHLYTDNLSRLYADTQTFELNATPVYASVMFFDGNTNFLGHFESGGVGTVLGVYGGKGTWS